MKIYISLIFALFLFTSLNAQVLLDNDKPKGVILPADGTTTDSGYKLDYKKKETPPIVDLKNPLTEPTSFSIETTTDLLDAGQELQKRWDESKMKASGARDQHLGDFITSGTFLSIECRDHLEVDGDRVQITVNGVIVEHSMTLRGFYQGINADLVDGVNTIEVLALNQGYAGENTAKFRVLDSKGLVITAQQWFLSTGFKASIVVVK